MMHDPYQAPKSATTLKQPTHLDKFRHADYEMHDTSFFSVTGQLTLSQSSNSRVVKQTGNERSRERCVSELALGPQAQTITYQHEDRVNRPEPESACVMALKAERRSIKDLPGSDSFRSLG